MKKYVICLSLLFTAPIIATNNTPKSYISNSYYKLQNNLVNHKGKACFVAGAVGTALVNKIFKTEIENYVKPFIKSVWKKTAGWLRRIFRSEKV